MNFQIQNAVTLITDKLETWVKDFIVLLPNLVVAIVVVLIFYLIAKLIRNVAHRVLGKVSRNQAVNNLILTIVYAGVVVIGFFIALEIMKWDGAVTSLLAGVGIVGLALGFAFQDIAANFIAGVIIAVSEPFRVGDILESGDNFGTVKDINLRTTIVTTFQGVDVIVPNKKLLDEVVINYTNTNDRRVDLSVGVSYGDNLQKVKDITIEAVKSVNSIDSSRDITLFYKEFGDSSINFVIRFWCRTARQLDFLQAQSDAIMAIKQAYDDNDIMIPFPIRTLDFGIKGGEKLSEMQLQGLNGKLN